MSSTSRIDYSLRQNKAIERSIVFDGLKDVYSLTSPREPLVYIGFGSVWFTDFHLAHRQLGVDDMISIEVDEVTATRAKFNRPYKTIEVLHGDSNDLIPELLERPDLRDRPWIVWLDYDKAMDEERIAQLDELARYAPNGSSIITTFSGTPGAYGRPNQRAKSISELFDFASPADLKVDHVRDEDDLSRVLAETVERRLVSVAIQAGRPRPVPLFSLRYRDGAPMVTVGVHLPGASSLEAVQELTEGKNWPGKVGKAITTPPLTSREVETIRSLLPAKTALTRADLQELGLDLEAGQLDAFVAHYRRYSLFAQLAF